MTDASPLLAVLGWLCTAVLLVRVVDGVAAARGVIPVNHLFCVRLPVAAFVGGVVWVFVRGSRAAAAVLRPSGSSPRRG